MYKDRLVRFGFELIENICKQFNTAIEIIDNTEKTEEQELVEDLAVSNMVKNHYLAKSIQNAMFGEIYRQLKYKCEWNGIRFVTADRFYPSSKICSKCGHVKEDLTLQDRTYVCSHCGSVIDRDLNASINLKKIGIHQLATV